MPKRGSSQLRKGRYSESNRIYFVTAVTQDRRRAFEDYRIARILILELAGEQSRGDLDSLAFVIMPDHFHWLVQLKDGADLSRCIGRVKSLSARALNSKLGRTGRFWQDDFHDHALRDEEDLKYFARYLVANPLRAGLVSSLRQYPLWDAVWV